MQLFHPVLAGWFCCAQPLRVKVNLEVLAPGPRGEAAGWQPVKIPKGVRALVVLNLQVRGRGVTCSTAKQTGTHRIDCGAKQRGGGC